MAYARQSEAQKRREILESRALCYEVFLPEADAGVAVLTSANSATRENAPHQSNTTPANRSFSAARSVSS